MNDTPHRPGLGSMPHEGGTAFRVWAPHADAVAVTGSFTEWSGDGHAMDAEDNGHWYADVEGVEPGDEYQFVIHNGDQRLMRIDPRARAVTNSSGNGVVYDRDAFDWQGDSFACPPHDELVIYETHIGSFMARRRRAGDLAGLAGKLDYLAELGINAIELMPVAEFAGDYSWGYNPSNPFAVESAYGGPDLLKAFVREAHRHGIAVIVDVVLNHFGPSDLALWQFDGWSENDKGGIYFYNDERSATPWGDTRPDYGREQVRAYLHDNALMWFEEYHMDGLRFDATLYIRTIDGLGTGDLPEGWDVMRVDHRQRPRDPPRQDPHRRGPPERRGPHDLRRRAAPASTPSGTPASCTRCAGLLTAVDDADRSMTELAEAIGADGNPFAPHHLHREPRRGRQRQAAAPAGDRRRRPGRLGGAEARDPRPRHRPDRPGIPMIFQGQEFLEDEWFRDDVPLDWERAEQFRDIVRLARDLIRLRRNVDGASRGLTRRAASRCSHLDDEAKTLAWARARGDDAAVVVVNASAEPRDITTALPSAGPLGGALQLRRLDLQRPLRRPRDPRRRRGRRSRRRPASPDGTVSVGAYTLVVLTPA